MLNHFTTFFDDTIDPINTLIGQMFLGGLFGVFLACAVLIGVTI